MATLSAHLGQESKMHEAFIIKYHAPVNESERNQTLLAGTPEHVRVCAAARLLSM